MEYHGTIYSKTPVLVLLPKPPKNLYKYYIVAQTTNKL